MSARPVAQFVDQAERNSASEIAERFDYSVPRTTYFSFFLFFLFLSFFHHRARRILYAKVGEKNDLNFNRLYLGERKCQTATLFERLSINSCE